MMSAIVNKISGLMKLSGNMSHMQIVMRDLFRKQSGIHADNIHLRVTMEWISRAQDVTGCGGVSGGYHFSRGWMPPYPENR